MRSAEKAMPAFAFVAKVRGEKFPITLYLFPEGVEGLCCSVFKCVSCPGARLQSWELNFQEALAPAPSSLHPPPSLPHSLPFTTQKLTYTGLSSSATDVRLYLYILTSSARCSRSRFFRRLRSDLTRSLLNLKNELGGT